MTALRPYAAAALLAAACSGPGDPGETTTWDQVQPLLASNCVRCHGGPAIDGAPDTFRLDVYSDVILDDRDDGNNDFDDYVLRGARSLRVAMATRTDPTLAESRGFELMPPTVHMEDYGHLILEGWFAGERADRAGNAAPTIEVEVRDADDEGRVAIDFEIRDADHDMVRGELRAGDRVIGELHSGRGTIIWDTAVVANGEYVLRARLDDGGGEEVLQRRVGEHTVDHANTAASVRILEPGPYALLVDGDAPRVRLDLVDPDDDPVGLVVEAIRGSETVVLFDGLAAVGRVEIPWTDFATATAGGNWRVRVTANGGLIRQTTSLPFRVSHASTTESAAFFDQLVMDRCSDSNCHNDPSGNVFRLTTLGDAAIDTSLRGRIYRRVVELENMPPPHKGEPYRLDAAERARIGDWLLGGAPP